MCISRNVQGVREGPVGVLATKVTPGVPGVKPVVVELTDFKTKEVVDTLEVDAVLVATGRAPYTQVSARAEAPSFVDLLLAHHVSFVVARTEV